MKDLHTFLLICPCTVLERPLGLQEVVASRISRQMASEGGKDVQPYALASFTHQEISLVLISVRGRDYSRAIVRPEGLSQSKIPVTPSGIEPATFQLVSARASILPHEHFISYVFFRRFAVLEMILQK